jgi:hypothetical protein
VRPGWVGPEPGPYGGATVGSRRFGAVNVRRRARYGIDCAVEHSRESAVRDVDHAKHNGYCEQLAGNVKDSSR